MRIWKFATIFAGATSLSPGIALADPLLGKPSLAEPVLSV